VVSVALSPTPVSADWKSDLACLFNPSTCTAAVGLNILSSLAASIGDLILTMSAWALAISGMVLNIAIVLTLNIKALYEATPAIDQIWLVIRNLSSMFIIFALIYTSILTILDVAKTSASSLIKNIIMAGILINFSLFFTKTLIDASNLVSLQFYRALVPNSATIDKNSISSILGSAWTENGLSDIFMQNLKLPSIYSNPRGMLTSELNTNFLNIALRTGLGSVLMWLAAGSILAAAIAFIIRVVILLLLMGFSPVYFVGMIFPQVRDNISGKWRGWLVSQLVFMPVYLLLMYVSVRFLTGINGMGFFNQLDAARASGGSNNFMMETVGLVLQYTIAYFVLIVPLMAALKLGGDSAKWGSDAQKWVSGKLWGGGNAIGGAIGRNSAGRIARGLGKGFDSMAASAQGSELGRRTSSVLRNIGVSQAVRGKLNQYENSKFGSKQSLGDVEKEDKDRSKVIAGIQRFKGQMSSINSVINSNLPPSTTQLKSFRDALGKMGVKEFEKFDYDTLKNPVFAANLSSQQIDKISESDFLTEKQKEDLKDARKAKITDIFTNGTSDVIKDHIKGMSGKELSKLETLLTRDEVIDNLTPSQLQDMRDMDGGVKRAIGDRIYNLPAGTTHKAAGYIRKNRAEWS
jgi:hypothetical protein